MVKSSCPSSVQIHVAVLAGNFESEVHRHVFGGIVDFGVITVSDEESAVGVFVIQVVGAWLVRP